MAAHYAANMMIPNKQGLIVNISSAGGLRYLFNIPYGVGKAAVSFYVESTVSLLNYNYVEDI